LYIFVKNIPLKNTIEQYKPFLLFLGKFFLSYLVLTICYKMYLSNYDETKLQVDEITQMVANQTTSVLQVFNNQSFTNQHLTEPSIKIFYNNKYVSRIIEGCNAVSVIILFIAFVVAFTGKFKNTLFFLIVGSIIIYVMNVFRIVLLTVALYHYPEYEHILHGVIFPLVIYGIVFLLWIIWVNKFSLHAK
jgi:exosortase family protein XrtF